MKWHEVRELHSRGNPALERVTELAAVHKLDAESSAGHKIEQEVLLLVGPRRAEVAFGSLLCALRKRLTVGHRKNGNRACADQYLVKPSHMVGSFRRVAYSGSRKDWLCGSPFRQYTPMALASPSSGLET
jgi:hypothetical protein